jgi:hypothetical protein
MGIPVYSGVLAMENNAIPYEFGNVGTIAQTSPSKLTTDGQMGGLVHYALTHWGARPSLSVLTDFLIATFSSFGLYFGSGVLNLIGLDILSSSMSDSAILFILGVDLTNPLGQALLAALASVIVAY